jgi:hypothetical protein
MNMAVLLALAGSAVVFYASCLFLDRFLARREARSRRTLRETKEYEASVHYIAQIDDELMQLLRESN